MSTEARNAFWGLAMAAVLVVVAAGGCNTLGRQPRFTSALIVPSELKPGDTAVITVDVKDRNNIIRKVEGVVQEDPAIKLKLRNDGQAPDVKAADSIWSLQVDVPFQAPPGDFILELTAYRADGTPVPVREKGGRTVPLSTALPVVIKSP